MPQVGKMTIQVQAADLAPAQPKAADPAAGPGARKAKPSVGVCRPLEHVC